MSTCKLSFYTILVEIMRSNSKIINKNYKSLQNVNIKKKFRLFGFGSLLFHQLTFFFCLHRIILLESACRGLLILGVMAPGERSVQCCTVTQLITSITHTAAHVMLQ